MSPSVSDQAILAGNVDLVVPHDLFDLLSPQDPEEARLVFADVFGRMFPQMTAPDRHVMVDGILLWRERLMADGCVLHGVVALPVGDDVPAPVHWHILAGVVDVPAAAELDTGALATRLIGQNTDEDRVYSESFETEMGWGVGLITGIPFKPPAVPSDAATADSGATAQLPQMLGLAAGLSAPRGGDRGLLVVGLCMDTKQTLDMAAIVAAIAGNSIIGLDAPGTESDDLDTP